MRPDNGLQASRDDLDAVTAFLRAHRDGATVFEITRGTRLGITVVIPALNTLVVNGAVQRRIPAKGAAEPTSRFRLTPAGRRR